MRWMLTFAVTAMIATEAFAQPTPPVPPVPVRPPTKPADEVEGLIQKVLKNNPDVRVAEAKLREAEAELSRARLLAVQKLLDARARHDEAKRGVEAASVAMDRQKRLLTSGAASREDILAAELALAKAKADVSRSETEQAVLYGDVLRSITPGVEVEISTPRREWILETGVNVELHNERNFLIARPPTVGGPVAVLVKKALGELRSIDKSDADLTLEEALKLIQPEKGEPIPYMIQAGVKGVKGLRLPNQTLPVGAWLLLIEDLSPDVRFIVREYGILVTTKDRVPDGAVSVRTFWSEGTPQIRALPPGAVPIIPKP